MAAAAADPSPFHHPSLNRSIHQSTEEEEEEDPSPLRQSLSRIINQSRGRAEAEAADPSPSLSPSMVADLQKTELPRRPLLWAISDDDTTLIAMDCLIDDVAPRFFTSPLPDRLHKPVLYASIGPWLHIEEQADIEEQEDLEEEEDLPLVWSQPEIILFNPFCRTELSWIPSPASLMLPGVGVRIHTIVIDINRRIALALVDNYEFRLVYTRFEDRDPCKGKPTWTDVTYLLSGHSISSNLVPCRDIYLQSAVLHIDGLFYAVDSTGTKVFAFDFSSPTTPTLREMTFDLLNNYFTSVPPVVDSCCYQSASLVSSGSSLFLVRWRNTFSKDGTDATRDIDVLTLDKGRKRWVSVKSLGHHSFFIGKHSSISLSVLDFPHLKRSRVYICLDAMMPISGNLFSCHYSVSDADCHSFRCHLLYNLEDKRWGVFFDKSRITPDGSAGLYSASVWMFPTTGASTGLARAAQRQKYKKATTHKQCRKRRMQGGKPKTNN